jgi:two-component system sensor histidine kinase VicK
LIINADRNKVTKVLNNLVNNAINSVSTGGHINVLAREADNQIRLEVQNDGPVIDSSEIHKIFNHFTMIKEQLIKKREQLTNLTTPLNDTGENTQEDVCDILLQALSLPIAKVLVELHGGRLWVESKQDKGNNFYFTLPKLTNLRKETSMVEVSAGLE